MFKTRITELFGIEHPIVGGCMMHISEPRVCGRHLERRRAGDDGLGHVRHPGRRSARRSARSSR